VLHISSFIRKGSAKFSHGCALWEKTLESVAMNKQKTIKIIEDGIKNKIPFRYWRKRMDLHSREGLIRGKQYLKIYIALART